MSVSFAELSSLYSNNKKAPSALDDEKQRVLPGATVYEKLDKLHFSRKSNSLFAAASSLASIAPVIEQKTIGICIVIVDSLPHEAIWAKWATEVSEGSSGTYKAKIAIHAKFPDRIKSEWVRERLVPVTYKPDWNSPEVIRAILCVMNECLRDPCCGRFIFATESCVPLYGLDHIGQVLFKEDASWLNAFNRGKSNWETQTCFRSVNDKVIPPNVVWKCIPGWIMLNRRHAAEISLLTAKSCTHKPFTTTTKSNDCCLGTDVEADLVKAWGKGGTWTESNGNVWAPEEVFFPTMLSILGYLKEGGKDEVKRRSVTYARFKKVGDANPITFANMDAALLRDLRGSGSLFGRKFGAEAVDIARWTSLMELDQPKSEWTKRKREDDSDSEKDDAPVHKKS